MSLTKEYKPLPSKLQWYIVKRLEKAGGGDYENTYVVEAYDTTEAIKIAMDKPNRFQYSATVAVVVDEPRHIEVVPYAEKEKEEGTSA